MNTCQRLLFVVNDPVFFLSHRLVIARAARDCGFEVHVATPREDCVDKILAEGFTFHPIPMYKHGISLTGEVRSLGGLYRLFKSLQPDIVHLVTIKPVLYGGVMARLARVPVVVSAVPGRGHLFIAPGLRVCLARFFAKRVYRLALNHPNQRVVFQNPDDQCYFVENGLVDRDRTELIKGSGVDLNEFLPSLTHSEPPVVLLAGRMLWEKGVGAFVEAARALKSEGIAARFVLVGDAPFWNRSSIPQKTLLAWCEEGVVEWWGERKDMPTVISGATLVCLPSYSEGLPKVLIEAAACGKPIVATDVPGCREICRHGINGLLVAVKSPSELARAIRTLLLDPDLCSKMGARGRQMAEEEFSAHRVVKETLALYLSLTGQVSDTQVFPCI